MSLQDILSLSLTQIDLLQKGLLYIISKEHGEVSEDKVKDRQTDEEATTDMISKFVEAKKKGAKISAEEFLAATNKKRKT